VRVQQQPSDTVPAGSVISMSPPGGTSLTPGRTVTLVVSTGPRQDTPSRPPADEPSGGGDFDGGGGDFGGGGDTGGDPGGGDTGDGTLEDGGGGLGPGEVEDPPLDEGGF